MCCGNDPHIDVYRLMATDPVKLAISHWQRAIEILPEAASPYRNLGIIYSRVYKEYDTASYAATAQMLPELVTGMRGKLIMPRALKAAVMKKERTKTKAEVFTPIWIVKKQNDLLKKIKQN